MDKVGKIIGCILGGAIGDCLGGPHENLHDSAVIDYDHKWKTSDDTQMTLATCEAISQMGKVDPSIIATTFTQWFKTSRFTGLGASTYKALLELSHGGHWALVGKKGEMAAGNGTAMRIAPLGFCLDPADSKSRMIIRDVCRITHHNEEVYSGALAVVVSVRAAWEKVWNGEDSLIEYVTGKLPDSSVRDRLIEINRMKENASIAEITQRYGCSGYIVETVPLALYAVQQVKSQGFKRVLAELVSSGSDTDTIASITGQIAGALIGYEELPSDMVNRLPDFDIF